MGQTIPVDLRDSRYPEYVVQEHVRQKSGPVAADEQGSRTALGDLSDGFAHLAPSRS
jgi:hypothetical protein